MKKKPFIKTERSAGLTAEICPGSTDTVQMMPRKKSENGFRTMIIVESIFWTPEITII